MCLLILLFWPLFGRSPKFALIETEQHRIGRIWSHLRPNTGEVTADHLSATSGPARVWGGQNDRNVLYILRCLAHDSRSEHRHRAIQHRFRWHLRGVSNTATGGSSSCNPFNPTPRPLTVSNGIAQVTGGWFTSGNVAFEGSVSPQGDFKMWDMFAHNLIGKIDPSGKATGSFRVGDTGCIRTAVWQRQ